MVSRLSDGEVRALLLQRLEAVAASETDAATADGVVEFVEKATVGFLGSITKSISLIPLLWETQMRSFGAFWIGSELRALGLGGGLDAGRCAGRVVGGQFSIASPALGTRRPCVGTATPCGGSIIAPSNRFCTDIVGVLIFFMVAPTQLPLEPSR